MPLPNKHTQIVFWKYVPPIDYMPNLYLFVKVLYVICLVLITGPPLLLLKTNIIQPISYIIPKGLDLDTCK